MARLKSCTPSSRTDSTLFVALVIVVTLIVVGLGFFLVLALGPLAEGLS
jgi:K+-transporting ATPase A subunit